MLRPKVLKINSAAKTRTAARAPEALTLLRVMAGVPTWKAEDVAKALMISRVEALRAITALEVQGYVKETGPDEYVSTWPEEAGPQSPPYTAAQIEAALCEFRGRIAEVNADSNATYKIGEAIAFGDFLYNRERVEPGEVAVQLVLREPMSSAPPVKEQETRRGFLRFLQGSYHAFRIRPYEEWMALRTHIRLV